VSTPSLLVKRALDRAAVLHRDQLRKYPGVAVPYVSHLAGVTVVLARHGFDDEVIAAGALHDAVEDTEATLAELAAEFGTRVAELVAHCSEPDKSLSWEQRKADYLARFPGKPWAAQAITLADKIDNLESILVCARQHGDPWAQFKRGRELQLARYHELRSAALGLPPHPLVDEFVAVLAAVEREA
jgi:(p)ppGpp synthase/HD superfamily hydrolase